MSNKTKCMVCSGPIYPKIEDITICEICACVHYRLIYSRDVQYADRVLETVRNWGGDRGSMLPEQKRDVLANRDRFCHQCLQLH